MSVTLSEEKLQFIGDIAHNEGITDYTVDIQAGSLPGDNYLGIINTVEIRDKNKSNRQLRLILKSAHASDKLREQSPVRLAYEREAFMYGTIFPAMRHLQEEKGVHHKFRETAQYYGALLTDKNECLVFENLKQIGYKLWNRMVPMDINHAEIVFATYGKFHAVSLAWKDYKPEEFDQYANELFNVMVPKDELAAKEMGAKFIGMFKNAFTAVEGNEKATLRLTNLAQTATQYFDELKTVDKYAVVNHGDCWCNNMLFKYEDPDNPLKPTEMCLIDWQIAKMGPAVLDLTYFLTACCPRPILYDYQRLLKVYHDSLSQTLREMGCDADKLFPYEELEAQWRKHAKFGIFISTMLIKVMLSESEEAADLAEYADAGKDIFEAFTTTGGLHEEAYLKRVADVIDFMVDHNFI